MADEIPFSPIAREMGDAKDQHDIANTLREFGKSARALRDLMDQGRALTDRDLMDQGRALTDMDVLFIDNHFHVIQMAYLRWKRKYRPEPIDPE